MGPHVLRAEPQAEAGEAKKRTSDGRAICWESFNTHNPTAKPQKLANMMNEKHGTALEAS
jgi:hypothetical protein